MDEILFKRCTAFEDSRCLASGSLVEVALAVKGAVERGVTAPILVFDDATGRVIDLDLRGDRAATMARLSPATHDPEARSDPPAVAAIDPFEALIARSPSQAARPFRFRRRLRQARIPESRRQH